MKFQTKGLIVGYNGKPLIRNIDITLEKGKILTLVGPNGSGKSTMLKSIAQQLEPLGGTIYLDKYNLFEMTRSELAKKIAVVLTERRQTELLTCQDVVESGRYPYTGMLGILSENDKLIVRTAMEQTDTWKLRGFDFMKISDGQKQRVLIARGIVQEPQIILLDEPTNYLDAKYIIKLLNILKQLSIQGVTLIISFHQLELAKKISDFVMCIKDGIVFRYGIPSDILNKKNIMELYNLSEESYTFLFGMEYSNSFFSNTKCEYFPCHKGVDNNEFNCLFCYCPLYFFKKCGGNFYTTKNGIKSCIDCQFPHIKENYNLIIEKLKNVTIQ